MKTLINEMDKLKRKFKCIHRHTGIDHPRCFDRAHKDGYVEGYLDIETTNLKANFGYVLSYFIKERGKKKLYKDWMRTGDFKSRIYDKRLMQNLIKHIQEFDVIYTYYGSRFDIPFIRSRALYFGYDFPIYKSINHIDLYYAVRSKLQMNSNRLDVPCEFFGISGKTHLSGPVWIDAMAGSEKAIKYVVEHNRQEVVILER